MPMHGTAFGFAAIGNNKQENFVVPLNKPTDMYYNNVIFA